MQASPNTLTRRKILKGARRLLAGFALACAGLAPGGTALADTLRDALLHAYQNNPTLNASRASILAISENLARAKSGYRPKINASADAGFYLERDKYPDGSRNDLNTSPRGVGLSLNQNVFDGWRTPNSVRQAKVQISEGEAIALGAEQDTLFAAVTAYMDVLADTATLNRIRRSANSLAEQRRQAFERHGFGEITKTDVAQVESRLAAAQAQASAALGNLKTSVATYRQVVGLEPQGLVPARSIEGLIPRSKEEVIARALTDHPAVHAASHEVSVQLLQTEIIRGEYLPTVSIVGQLTRRADVSERGDDQSTAALLGKISIPLYDGGDIKARAAQSRHVATQRALETDAVRDRVRQLASATWAQYRAADERAANSRAQLKAATSALDGIREQWAAGDRTMREVLDAEQEYLSAEISLISAEHDRIVATFGIARAAGCLTLASLVDSPLTAPYASVFELRSETVPRRLVEPRAKQACDKDCPEQTEGLGSKDSGLKTRGLKNLRLKDPGPKELGPKDLGLRRTQGADPAPRGPRQSNGRSSPSQPSAVPAEEFRKQI
jgi:outer membrane protein